MDYYTILTDAGRALEAAALAGQARYTLETCVLGDSTEMPDPAQNSIRNEVWRGPISTLTQDPDNPTWLVIEVNVPPSDGGFTIREFGIYTDTGVLFAVGNYPETYKPALTEGTGVDLVVRPICEVSNATLVTLLTDTSIMMASKKYVDEQVQYARHRHVGEVFYYQGRSAPFGTVVADGRLVRRDLYPDLWKFAQDQNLVIAESEWQTQIGTQGSVGVYSAGDGSATFRLPLLTDFFRGAVNPDTVGTWQGDAIRNITGMAAQYIDPGTADAPSGAFFTDSPGTSKYQITTGTNSVSMVSYMDASRVVPTAPENRPKTLFFLPCIHAYNAIIPKAQADMHSYLTALADKEDKIKTLTADTTIYVRTTGNDNNSGLTPADATATVQRAFQIAMLWRPLTYSVTIDIGPGTWPTISVPRALYAVSNLYIKGAGSAATIISPGTTAVGIIVSIGNPIVHISNLKITNANIGLHAGVGAIVYLREDIEFGISSSYHIVSSTAAAITIASDWKISGNAAGALYTDGGGVISMVGRRLTLSGTINFSTAFAVASATGYINTSGFTYAGAATGMRYSIYLNGAIYTAGGGANYFPGNAAGSMHTGGQYL